MTQAALALVLLSAMAHAAWNFLLKRAINQEVFIWCVLLSISILLLPLAIVLILQSSILYPGWRFILGTVVLHALYFVFLGRSYTYADLSLVYPIARGVGSALVPMIGVLVLKETIASPAIAGIAAVVFGIYTVYWSGHLRQILQDPFKLFRDASSRYALLTGLVITAYSVWDKVGVRYVNPFLYMYLLALGSTLFLMPYVLWHNGTSAIRIETRKNIVSIAIAALLMFLSYALILLALQFSRVSYIAPSREIGIVMGVILGTLFLKEPFGKGRVLGSCFIVLGLVLISLAP